MSPYTDAVDAHRTAAEIIDAQMRERMAAARAEETRGEWEWRVVTQRPISGGKANTRPLAVTTDPALTRVAELEAALATERANNETLTQRWREAQEEKGNLVLDLIRANEDLEATKSRAVEYAGKLDEALDSLAAAQAELARREQVWEDRFDAVNAQVKALQEMRQPAPRWIEPTSCTEWPETPLDQPSDVERYTGGRGWESM